LNYQRNNIAFRISSAIAIGKLKTAQAHAFQQLLRRELDFDDSAKEGVLLEFDQMSNWIFRIEKICLSAAAGELSIQLRRAIYASFVEELRMIMTVMETNANIFSKDVRALTSVIHEYSSEFLVGEFERDMMVPADMAFARLTMTISDYLQHYLVAMHEFNNNIIRKAEPAFLSIAEFCTNSSDKAHRFIACLKRAKFFQQCGCRGPFVFKNYTKEDIFNDAKAFLADNGVDIIPEEMHEELHAQAA
jgi:hypothetical protein